MSRIVGVHGISQQYESGPELTSVWLKAIRGGLEAAGNRPAADALGEKQVRVAFWGDLFRPDGEMSGAGPLYTSGDVLAGPERDLLEVWYDSAVKHDRSLGSPDGAMRSGRASTQVMVERLLRSRTFAHLSERLLVGNLKQVVAFMGDLSVKERVLQRVVDEVTDDTAVIIGHSLGSVVVYEYLARFAPVQVQLLVTIGSPLGIPRLVFDKLTPAPVLGTGSWPGIVPRWLNVAEADDVVALCKQLAPLFPARAVGAALGVEDHMIDSGGHPHAASRYLNSATTGAALASALFPVP